MRTKPRTPPGPGRPGGARLLLALLATLLAPSLGAEPVPDGATLLGKIEKTYRASPAFTMTFVQAYAPAGFPDAAPETGTLTVQPPASLRFDYDGAEGKVYTFDGSAARQYVAADRQMIVKTLTPSERGRLPLLFLEPKEAILSRFDAATRTADNGLLELTLTPRAGGDPRSVTLLLAPAGEVKRLVVVDAEGNRTTFTFTRQAAAKKRPAADFALVPPKGTKVVTP